MSQKNVAKKYHLRDNCIVDENATQNGGGIVHIKQNHPIQTFFRKLKFKIPMERQVELDAFGLFVVQQIAQGATKAEIIERLEDKFGDAIRPTQNRLDIFLKQLENMRIIRSTKI